VGSVGLSLCPFFPRTTFYLPLRKGKNGRVPFFHFFVMFPVFFPFHGDGSQASKMTRGSCVAPSRYFSSFVPPFPVFFFFNSSPLKFFFPSEKTPFPPQPSLPFATSLQASGSLPRYHWTDTLFFLLSKPSGLLSALIIFNPETGTDLNLRWTFRVPSPCPFSSLPLFPPGFFREPVENVDSPPSSDTSQTYLTPPRKLLGTSPGPSILPPLQHFFRAFSLNVGM